MVFTPLYERVLKRILVEKSVDFMQQLPIDGLKNPFEVALRFPREEGFTRSVVMAAGNRRCKYALPRAAPCISKDQHALILANAYKWRDYLVRPAFLGHKFR
jgi:hypothetical protein